MTSRDPRAGADTTDCKPTSPHRQRTNRIAAPLILRMLRLVFETGGQLAPGLTGKLASKFWYKTTRFPLPAVERKALRNADGSFREINGSRIATYEWGKSGAAILLVHGWNGRASQLAPFVRPLLKAGYRVLGFDAPAHGNSAGRQTTIFAIADVILEINKCDGPFHAVITHSFGGPSLALAMKQDFIAERIVCLCPPASTAGLVDKFARTLHINDKSIRAMKRLIEKRFGKDVWSEVSMVNNVSGQIVPAMIIHDEEDSDIPWQEGFAVSQAWPGSRFIKTRHLGHHRILRDTTTIQKAVGFIG